MLFIVNIYGFVVADDGLMRAILFAFILFFTGPGTIVGVTLILLLNYDTILIY